MKLTALKDALTSKVGHRLLVVQKHSPALLFGAGVVGMVATVVMASRATLRLDEVLQETEKKKDQAQLALETVEDYSPQDHKRDMVIIQTKFLVDLVKLYGPAVAMGLASITALTSSHVILNRRNLGVMAAYAALERGFEQYRKRVVDEYGEDKDNDLRHGIHTEVRTHTDADGKTVEETLKSFKDGKGSIYAFFFDERSSSWSKDPGYNSMFLKCQEQYATDRLRAIGHLFLNDVHDMLGMPRTREGAVVGWLASECGGDGYVDFGVFRNDVYMGQEFVSGNERTVLIDPNVDGVIWDKI